MYSALCFGCQRISHIHKVPLCNIPEYLHAAVFVQL